MPHLVIEYSKNIEDSIDIVLLMETVYNAAVASGVMQASDIKVRALPYSHYRLADEQDTFVHVSCRLLAGRSAEQKLKLSNLLRDHMSDLMPHVYSISVDIIDMDPEAYKKRLLEVTPGIT